MSADAIELKDWKEIRGAGVEAKVQLSTLTSTLNIAGPARLVALVERDGRGFGRRAKVHCRMVRAGRDNRWFGRGPIACRFVRRPRHRQTGRGATWLKNCAGRI